MVPSAAHWDIGAACAKLRWAGYALPSRTSSQPSGMDGGSPPTQKLTRIVMQSITEMTHDQSLERQEGFASELLHRNAARSAHRHTARIIDTACQLKRSLRQDATSSGWT